MAEEHKFNFSEEEKQAKKDQSVEEKKETVKKDAKGLWQSINSFLSELLDFREDTDRDATMEAIKADIPFKGATAWILVCSIFIASVGLNADSTAVVIGAMLISPLMGPILGVGLSIAVNDIYTLKRSLINLATMIVLSLLTAFLFFYLFPLSEDTNELFARTKPDVRDVLIAFFGGLALIIARTKKGTIASVIFGVAIATALMPPLCTAGYGLSQGNLEYFAGAMYLFTINTIFIALATFLVLKILRFPMIRYANSKRRRFVSRLATLTAVVVMIPAVWTFVNVLKESNFERDANSFVENELKGLRHYEYLKKNAIINYERDGLSSIELNTFGFDELSESSEDLLRSRMRDYKYLEECQLIINQSNSKNIDNFRYMTELRSRDSLELMSQQEKIIFLENKVKSLALLEKDQIPFDELIKELKINYENLEKISFANEISSNLESIDTVKVFNVKWKDSASTNETRLKDTNKIRSFLKERLDLDTLVVKQNI
ncbi:DUF389 domain-containing protein [Winogradskyella sp. A3E31]|uniref:DUF389 domain-containing protein n=1 Tax=Winogradskyella sp. A3E31 TaxID=3349637 RepID=UPI00398BBA5E